MSESLAFIFVYIKVGICKKQIPLFFCVSKGFRFAGCRLLQLPLAKDLFYSVLPSPPLLQTFGSTDVTFVYIVGTGVPDCPHQINLFFAFAKTTKVYRSQLRFYYDFINAMRNIY